MTVLGITQATQTRLARRRQSMSTPQVPVVVSLAQITDLFYFIELVILSERTNVLQSALLLDVMYRCATDLGDGPDGGRGRQGLEPALDPHSWHPARCRCGKCTAGRSSLSCTAGWSSLSCKLCSITAHNSRSISKHCFENTAGARSPSGRILMPPAPSRVFVSIFTPEVPLNWDGSNFRQLVFEEKTISSESVETSMRHL